MSEEAIKQEGTTTGAGEGTGEAEAEKVFSQADLDRAVSKAIKTFEANRLKEEQNARMKREKELAEKSGDLDRLKKALEEEKAALEREKLNVQSAKIFADKGLADFSEYVSDLSTLDSREKFANFILEVINKKANQMLEEKMKTRSVPKTTGLGSQKKIEDLSPEEWALRRSKI